MSELLALRADSGALLNATVELHSDGMVVHSRSGTNRNRDYRPALELLMDRLDRAGIAYEIYLDSRPVQQIPREQRRLTFDPNAPVTARFDQLVRAMNSGSSSHGAWRRLFLATSTSDPAALRSALGVSSIRKEVERLPARQLRQVTSAHIHRAVSRLLAGEDAPNFEPSRDYDALTDDGIPLAPKKVFGLALEDALGIDVYPGHFSAGWSQVCFELLETAGLWIVPKQDGEARSKARAAKFTEELAKLIPTAEERSWIEGNPRIVSHLIRERQPGLARQKRAEFIEHHGRLYCEHCLLDPVERYGPEVGAACIEVHHHRVHVSKMSPGHRTVTDDLMCLCANCHRVLHRKLTLGSLGGD
jgi:hypothetical protein